LRTEYDVIVVGGGPAGITAAVQSARVGASTLLVEKTGQLGGTASTGGVNFPGLFHAWTKPIVGGVGWELIDRVTRETNATLPDFTQQKQRPHHTHHVLVDRFVYAMICDEVVLESGADCLSHAMPIAVREADARQKTLTVACKEGPKELHANVLIDTTGDANLVSLAGYPVRVPNTVQPGTMVSNLSGYDFDSLDLEEIQRNADEEVAAGRLKYTDLSWDSTGFNSQIIKQSGRNANHIPGINARTSEGKTQIDQEGRRALLRLYRFLRRQPGLENLTFEYVSPECGVRETVTIEGEVEVTAADYQSGRLWEDAVCHSFYPIDLHTSDGKGLSKHYLEPGIVPTIPRRAMLPKGSTNFLVAGRSVCSDREANSALRVQASCMAMGQAAGATAALAAQQGVTVAEVPIEDIRRTLHEHRAIVPGYREAPAQ
jgi:hypothetical protein